MRGIACVGLCLAWLSSVFSVQPPLANGQDDHLLEAATEGESSSKALAKLLLAYHPTHRASQVARTRTMSTQHYGGNRIPVMSEVQEEEETKATEPEEGDAEEAKPEKPEKTKIVQTETYSIMMKTLLRANESSLRPEISSNFMLVDKTFLEELERERTNMKNNETVRQRLTEVKDIVEEETTQQIQIAAATVQELFSAPSAVVMEAKMVSLANQGRVTNVLLELLDANLAQAQLAGDAGKNAVIGITRLRNLTQKELDKKLSPIQAFFRQLLRIDDSSFRKDLITEKLRGKMEEDKFDVPKKRLLLGKEGEETTKPMITSEIDQREFVQFLTDMKTRFGNVDEAYQTGFVKRFEAICEEAEQVALELSGGKRLTAREAQDKAAEESHVSVWNLEQMEQNAHQDGNMAIWEEEAQEQLAKKENEEREKAVKDIKLR